MNFPIYRRLKNGKSLYRISAPDQLTELQQLGNKWMVHEVQAKILPERLLIADIIHNEGNHYEAFSGEEFERLMLQVS